MSAPVSQVFGASVSRHRRQVHVLLQTSLGPATLVFPEALAATVGRELGRCAVRPVGEHENHAAAAAAGAPLLKPSWDRL